MTRAEFANVMNALKGIYNASLRTPMLLADNNDIIDHNRRVLGDYRAGAVKLMVRALIEEGYDVEAFLE